MRTVMVPSLSSTPARRRLQLPLLCLFFVSLCLCGSSLADPPEAFNDAELTSITFVDADTGWAVGDRGVVWHTIDGGRHWQRQDAPTRARLESVSFADAENGWAVGGLHTPYTHYGFGVVLRTVDGGRTWQNLPGLNLPALNQVAFFGPKRGIAVGESSSLFPGGVFMTGDGGRSWSSLPLSMGKRTAENPQESSQLHLSRETWQSAAFLHLGAGVFASRGGRTAMLGELGDLRPTDYGVQGLRRPQSVALTLQGIAWVCGDGGLIRTSSDFGATWHAPDGELPTGSERIDFKAVAARGSHVWLAGEPGSIVVHSNDAGRTWQTSRTDSNVPLNGLCFLDEQRGWAVGALGSILATRDGGRTWRPQRQAGTRAALLAVFSEFERVPHEMLVQQAGNEGYLTAVELLTRKPGAHSNDDSSRQAVSTLLASHCSTNWRFPLSGLQKQGKIEQILSGWDGAGQGRAIAQIEEHLVQRIRTWRPDVIVTEEAHPQGDDPLAHIANQLVLAAVEKASDPAAYRQQIIDLGLAEWKVKKIFATASGDKQGDVKLVCSQLAPRIGASLADVADEARGQVDSTYRIAPSARGFTLLVDHLPQGQGRRDFFSGIPLTPGGEARRSLSNPPVPDFTALSKQIQKRQMLQNLFERSERDPLRGAAWLAQVTEMTKGLSPAASGRVMYHLAQRYQSSGESELSAEVMSTLIEKQPDHPLSDASLCWLIYYHASGEAAHRLRTQSRSNEVNFATDSPAAPADVRPASVEQPAGRRGQTARAVAADPVESNPRLERAIVLGKQLERTRPLLFAIPAMRYTLASVENSSGPGIAERDRVLQSLADSPAAGAWSECAQAELWIKIPSRSACPKKCLAAKATSSKPKLDGRLDDEAWRSARPVSLSGSPGSDALPAVVAIAYDEDFLYVAISCRRSAEAEYVKESRTRERDGDLEPHDRVELLLDIDRDYTSFYRLAIDHRGWTSEACFDDPSWNPTWYVAAAGDADYWTAEAAIPLAELTRDKTLKKSHWAVGLRRIIPATSVHSWTGPVDLEIEPEAFGLLQFE